MRLKQEYLHISICTWVPLKVIKVLNQIQMEIPFKVGKWNLEPDLSLCNSNLSLTVEKLNQVTTVSWFIDISRAQQNLRSFAKLYCSPILTCLWRNHHRSEMLRYKSISSVLVTCSFHQFISVSPLFNVLSCLHCSLSIPQSTYCWHIFLFFLLFWNPTSWETSFAPYYL